MALMLGIRHTTVGPVSSSRPSADTNLQKRTCGSNRVMDAKGSLTSVPILSMTKTEESSRLVFGTDAGDHDIGAVLSVHHANGFITAISYANLALRPSKVHYCAENYLR